MRRLGLGSFPVSISEMPQGAGLWCKGPAVSGDARRIFFVFITNAETCVFVEVF